MAGIVLPGPARAEERVSGFALMSPELQAMQRDDMANPGMLWVADGATLWAEPAGAENLSCADCHGEPEALAGAAARYPAFDARLGAPTDLEGRVNLCRTRHQGVEPLPHEGRELLALTALVAHQSRGRPIAPDPDPRLGPWAERGAELFASRMGQLDLSCAICHDDHAGARLAASVIPQAHPTGYPQYRLEWQGLGSLGRRLDNCMTGMRAEPFARDSEEALALKAYLARRAAGLEIETPAVRP